MDSDSAFSNSSLHKGFADGIDKEAFISTYRRAISAIDNVDEAAKQTAALAKQVSQDQARIRLVGGFGEGAGEAYASKKDREKQVAQNRIVNRGR